MITSGGEGWGKKGVIWVDKSVGGIDFFRMQL